MDNQIILNKKGRIHWYSAVILSIAFLYIGILLPASNMNIIIKYSFLILIGVSSFFLFYLKNGSKIRWLLFSVMAFIFVFQFMSDLFLIRGHIGIQESDIENGLPFCHIAIVNQLLSIPLLKSFVSPANLSGEDTAIYSMVVIWFWATILIGKGWCSWGCFYGGWDNLFSKIIKKPLVKISDSTARKLRLFPYALMIAIAILSLFLFIPVFCTYLCPFKTVTEFDQVTNYRTWILFIITVAGFLTFCITLPVFFGKRIWCTYLCPFGAFQSLIGKVFRIFKVKIDKDKCIDCKKCVNECITLGITESSLRKGKSTNNCSLCGACAETCPKKAINITAFGIKDSPRYLFDKITGKLSNIKILSNIRNVVSNIIDDVLNPQTFLYFFGFAVLVTFLSGFYFGSVDSIYKLMLGGK